MAADFLGNPLTDRDPVLIAGLDDFVGGFLAYETRAETILGTAAAHPGAVMAQVYAGWLWMFLEAPEAPAKARPYLDAARAALKPGDGPAHAREREQVELLAEWVAGDTAAVERRAALIAQRWPQDLAVVKLAQYLAFNRGDAPAMLRSILAVLPDHAHNAHVQGMVAFAYEQCHRLDEAEAAARLALTLQRREPWAQHALAHVLLTRGRVDEGLHFLEAVSSTWTGLNSFMLTHLWWHLALFYLARGRFSDALSLYDSQVWGVSPGYSQDQIGAVQLLARLEWVGVDVGPRWTQLAEHLTVRADDTTEPFLSLLYLLGLARAGRPEADRLLAAIMTRADAARGEARIAWRDAALPVAQGLVALARGDAAAADAGLSQGLPRLVRIGGSHAQRDLFAQLQIDAAMRAGNDRDAQQALEQRRLVDPLDVPVNARLATLYERLGLPGLAADARTAAAA
ncbi:tetratricopeptide repeat protein [Roseateles sp.]|uniref:tetratricopeptide repeat protein n=1 Tax=Roseateles sp. TaxID=1971397 RepID=UPI0039ED4E3D